jgi:hypothetical protein
MRHLALVLSLAFLASVSTAAPAALPKVPRWERFELTLPNPKPYPDPYRDVSLDVTLTRPDGRTVAFWGFHDGGQTWKFRFMPDLGGVWRYDAKFSDGSPGGQGSFECVITPTPGMIGVYGANPIWFGYQGGTSVTLRGFHVGDRFFARNWDDADKPDDGEKRRAFLDWVERQGYNTLTIASHYLNRNSPGRGQGWDTPLLWPLNASEYQRMERILDDLARRQINVYPFAGFFGRDSNFPRDPADEIRYIRYTIARLGAYRNLFFNVGGPEPRLRGAKQYFTVEDVNRLGAAIARLDPFQHALTIHNPTGNDEFKDAPWHTFGTLQGPKTLDRRRLADGLLRNHHAAKPLLAQETLWSGNVFHIRSNKGDYSNDDLRKNAFVIQFSAANFVFADNDGDSSSGFTGTLEPAHRKQPRHDILKQVWDTFDQLPFGRTKPAPEAVSSSEVSVFCLADAGRDYLFYFERRGAAQVRLAAGNYDVEWINAQRPTERQRARLTAADSATALAPPSTGDDWIAHLSRR